ncbi:MAG: DUF1836 domain-containing protein [Lachnospiraceae bacterium]|jgi:hypothetical protein|nr:DUF1836 domain-containing protein [Lachnospiraceae bacterium]
MTLDIDDLIGSLMASLDRIDYIKAVDIPNIDLYMDQVTTFMESRLKNTTRNPGEDKVLTKTMINNYAKNNLLPPPDKKKYSREHMYVLIFIYYFKNILSINDIDIALKPIKERYFGEDRDSKPYNVEDIYEAVRTTAENLTDSIKEDLLETYKTASGIFPEAEGEDEEILTMFSFITLLVLDVYIKKLLIEKMVDGYSKKLGYTSDAKSDKDKK